MLDSMGRQVAIEGATSQFLSPEGLFALTLASGGVPRDYLTTFVEAVKAARDGGATKWLTPKWIYRGASRVSYRTKLTQLRADVGADAAALEPVLQDLLTFCLEEKKKTAFLIAEKDARERPDEHDRVLQLMDFKLIHVVEPDTSAASGREGRCEAYTLDFAFSWNRVCEELTTSSSGGPTNNGGGKESVRLPSTNSAASRKSERVPRRGRPRPLSKTSLRR
jgi:hypothetical protein